MSVGLAHEKITSVFPGGIAKCLTTFHGRRFDCSDCPVVASRLHENAADKFSLTGKCIATVVSQKVSKCCPVHMLRSNVHQTYVFSGAVMAGNRSQSWVAAAQYWPSSINAIDTVGLACRDALTALSDLTVTCTLPRALIHESTGELVFGGWSLGVQCAYETAGLIDKAGWQIAAIFAIDQRSLLPSQVQQVNEQLHARNEAMKWMSNAAIVHKSSRTATRLVDNQPVQRYRFAKKGFASVSRIVN